MTGVKAAAVLFLAALLQLSVLTQYPPFRTGSIVLVVLLALALLRGSVFGAVAGFGAGLLLDTATLGTLGVTSLLLTVAGFWIGRYGETTARDRFHSPFLSVAVVTVLYAFGQLVLQFVLGEPAPAGLVAHGLPLGLVLNLVLTWPVYSLVRRLFPAPELSDRVREVRLLVSGTPRSFLPPDPRVEEPYLLTPQLAFRVAVLAFLALGIFAVLFLRLWALEVLSGSHYLAQANDNRVRTLSIDAPRGAVLDRNGRVLVSNVAGTRVEIWPADLPKTWTAELTELRALQTVTGVSVHDVVQRLKQHGSDPLTPVIVQSALHRDQIFYLSEHRAQFPGVELAESWLRSYPNGSLGAQVLGYVGQISPSEYKKLKKQGYQPTDAVGQSGVELSYDNYLRGHDGTAELTVDSLGRPKSAVKPEVLPRPGDALRLTIDVKLQHAAEKALRYGIQLARSQGRVQADGGAIVAMDPRDGSILAMASNPTYEPSAFVGRKSAKKLAPLLDPTQAAKANTPLLNRAIDAAYPPGSTFKPVTALAAMQEHILTPYQQLSCTPTFTAFKQVFHNWTPLINQSMDLETAIAESCDTYFYALGEGFYKLPANRGHALQAWANRFGLGQPTGVDLAPESVGLIPTPEWRCKAYGGPPCSGYVDRVWKPGYSIQLAIGQGQVTTTPLQMTRLYAMIANGGNLVTPHVADDVEQASLSGQPERVLRRFAAQPPQPTGVDPTALRFVQQGLYEATHATIGTSSGVFGNFKVPIAGKTGSAEKLVNLPGYPNAVNLTQSWWCGYGPYDSPTIVVCAVIENGGEGGSAAAPTALKVFEQYFHTSATPTAHPSD